MRNRNARDVEPPTSDSQLSTGSEGRTLAGNLRTQAYIFIALVVIALLSYLKFSSLGTQEAPNQELRPFLQAFLLVAVLALAAFTIWLVERKPNSPPPAADTSRQGDGLDLPVLKLIRQHNSLIQKAVEPVLQIVGSHCCPK